MRAGHDSNPAARRLAEEMAEAETEMVQRGVDAREGASFAVNQAARDFRRDMGDIGRQRKSLAQRKGVFTSSLLEREVLVQRYEDDSVELYPVPEEDDQLPAGLPAWRTLDMVALTALDEVVCLCGSRWRFGCCHGKPADDA